MKWKSGKDYPKSVVITDFGTSTDLDTSTSIKVGEDKRAVGTPGWAPPEQWISQSRQW